jgi:hypothetical protein
MNFPNFFIQQVLVGFKFVIRRGHTTLVTVRLFWMLLYKHTQEMCSRLLLPTPRDPHSSITRHQSTWKARHVLMIGVIPLNVILIGAFRKGQGGTQPFVDSGPVRMTPPGKYIIDPIDTFSFPCENICYLLST